MNLGLDPVQGERHQTHAALGVKTTHCLHKPDIAFLNQIRLRQAVAQVAATDRDDQPQVRQHKLPRGIKVVRIPQPAAKLDFLLGRQQRKAVDRLNVMVKASQRRWGRKRKGSTRHRIGLL